MDPDEAHRAARRDELGVVDRVRARHQRRPFASGWAARTRRTCSCARYDFARIEALQQRGEWDALGDAARRRRRVACRRPAPSCWSSARTPCTCSRRDRGGHRHPAAAHRRRDRRRRARRGPRHRRAARHALHDGDGLLPRPPRRGAASTSLVPDEPDRTLVHDVIYDELVRGIVSERSRARVPAHHRRPGRARRPGRRSPDAPRSSCWCAESDLDVPLFPTARLHALAAVEAALAE